MFLLHSIGINCLKKFLLNWVLDFLPILIRFVFGPTVRSTEGRYSELTGENGRVLSGEGIRGLVRDLSQGEHQH